MQSAPIDLNRVRQVFNDPTARLAADFIYREIATRMLERLQLVRLAPRLVLDAGCGRGADLPVFKNLYPKTAVIGLDSSLPWLSAAKKEHAASKIFIHKLFAWMGKVDQAEDYLELVCADLCKTPFAEQAFDLVWSNMALHWHSEPDRVFAEWHRLLHKNGLLMFSCFGPDSLKEIRIAFQGVDANPHTMPFVDMHDFGDMLVKCGFATPVMDMEVITLTYSSVDKLLGEVRALGGNPLESRRKGLLGKGAWRKVRDKLEGMRDEDGRIALTLEIIYGHAFRPDTRRLNPGESVIKFDMPKK